MKRSGSQKFLLVISVINVVLGVLGVVYSIYIIMRDGISGGVTTESLVASGVAAGEAEQLVANYTIITVLALVTSIVSLVEGILGIRAANDNQKILPVWFISLLGIAFAISNFITTLFQGGFQLSTLLSLIGPALMFWIANNIKKEAGK